MSYRLGHDGECCDVCDAPLETGVTIECFACGNRIHVHCAHRCDKLPGRLFCSDVCIACEIEPPENPKVHYPPL